MNSEAKLHLSEIIFHRIHHTIILCSMNVVKTKKKSLLCIENKNVINQSIDTWNTNGKALQTFDVKY